MHIKLQRPLHWVPQVNQDVETPTNEKPNERYIPPEENIDKLGLIWYTYWMEYQEIINWLHNKIYQKPKCRTKNQVQINNSASGTYNTNNQVIFKTVTFKSSLLWLQRCICSC